MKKTLFFTLFILLVQISNAQTPIAATIGYQGYDETQSYLGQAEYQMFIDTTDGVFDKPIILVDGFDPNDTRDIAGMYTSLGYNGTNIADQLRAEGFDFVFLNFPVYTRASDQIVVDGGSDYIQRNAMILIELINQVNNLKVGAEQLVVVGPSMGGLISRYALRYMEQNNMSHDTRLYVSWDAPHQGANLPIEFQYLLNYMAEINGGNADLQAAVASTLNSPASKEMLLDHYSAHLQAGSTFEQDPSILLPIGAANFRTAFQTELDAMGLPQQTRNISIANGSGIGSLTGTPGMEILNHTFDVPNVANTTIDIQLHFSPLANQNIEVTKAVTVYLGFITLATFTANAQSFNYTDGLDSAPGGKYDIQLLLTGAQNNTLITELVNNLQQSEFCFIPTISAMAIDNENNWNATIDIPATHNSPFDAFYIPTLNEDHVTPTVANVAFVLPEIRNQVTSVRGTNFEDEFKLVQNPISNRIKIKTTTNFNNLNIDVLAITGQQLISKQIKPIDNEFSIPVSLANGVYFLQITANGKIFTKKVIVNK